MKKSKKLRKFEIALLIALCVTFCTGMWAQNREENLAGSLVRLHVVANSDSEADQTAKLAVRDKVLVLLSPALESAETQNEAAAIINSYLPQLQALAGDGGTVTLSEEAYPTRTYGGFSLPAGDYLSLRVVLGAGEGHNWWCVVFPPLCTEALAAPSQETWGLLDEDDEALITQENESYVIKFRIVELWGELKGLVSPAK